MTKVISITCPKCGYTIFSRTRHDCRSCFCKSVNIDGGFEYTKVGFDPKLEPPQPKEMEVSQTPKELYDDWNDGTEKFGFIPPVLKKGEK